MLFRAKAKIRVFLSTLRLLTSRTATHQLLISPLCPSIVNCAVSSFFPLSSSYPRPLNVCIPPDVGIFTLPTFQNEAAGMLMPLLQTSLLFPRSSLPGFARHSRRRRLQREERSRPGESVGSLWLARLFHKARGERDESGSREKGRLFAISW